MTPNDVRCTREIQSRIAIAKSENSLRQQVRLNLKKLISCDVRSVAFYGVETWTFREVDKNYLDSFEM
jgi:hypothetical protein